MQPPTPSSPSESAGSNRRTTSINRLRTLSRLLDEAIAIPGTNYRIGLDPLIGLLPGGGDLVSSILSAYMVVEAARLGVPKESLVRMVVNIILDTLAGTVPVVGDLFDVAWKANVKNLELIESHMDVRSPQPRKKSDRWFVFGLLAILALVVIGAVTISLLIVGSLLKLLGL